MGKNSGVPRTAYILQIHKNPNQVNKFIKQIISEEVADVFVHLDRKKYDQLKIEVLRSRGVYILQDSIDVKWGDISQVDATLLLIREVLATGKDYDFICFRSGQDMLVKNGFKEFLLNNKNKIFMNAYYVDRKEPHAAFVNVKWPLSTRKLYINSFHPNRVIRRLIACLYGYGWNLLPNKNPLPKNFSIYNGSNWFCIPIDVAKYILEFINDNKWYYETFKNSLVPDEFFFQTIIMNSKYKSEVINNNLMYIKFGESLKSRNNPITLKMEHIDTIQSSNKFFARKFDENVDLPVIEYFSNWVKM
ncbi:beta-1,6-N-acetylglucosaminyltransferase [Neobacillus sp. PS3-34]|uniref:beta-1,6-N-acetylglucosaminyltransferase n=1 Tax=Neobacillus sp. PS3-34 TaxID=3070678 RepID=UPI0027DFE36B|nr:beta-1,6-N-acetylglucosaminyltransferase [Neobacillus sp. PS3-34]WML47821.1 beta-1,6-N-acetylglucosaminyltransferase [Neobacillus sp. PS3-34]